MDYQDYYKILGVERNADEKVIRKAYRDLARKFHPDRNPGDKKAEAKFKQINEAYEVLSDPEKRVRYDQLGPNYQQWQRMGGQGGNSWSDFGGGSNYRTGDFGDNFSDFFSSIFGGGRQRETYRQPIRGRDLEQPIEITLEEAYHGTERVLNRGGKRRTIRIPPGAKDGTRIRVAGEGEPGYASAQPGDLFLIVSIRPHPIFECREDDLYTDLKVNLYTAVLGGEILVPTLAGDVKLRIPAGTQSGKTIRIADRGMPHLREPEEKGDLYVRVLIQVPTNLSDEERTLFRKLAALRPNQG
jgi:curved DNA-binding protein